MAPLSVKKQEYHEPMVCLSKCTVELMEKCERVNSVHMKKCGLSVEHSNTDSGCMENGGLSVAQPSVDVKKDNVCGATSTSVEKYTDCTVCGDRCVEGMKCTNCT